MKDRAKRGIVDFLTNAKVIQAFLTGSTFGVLNRIVNLGSVIVVRPLSIAPERLLSVVLMAGVATFWYWADRNQDRFEALVEEAAE